MIERFSRHDPVHAPAAGVGALPACVRRRATPRPRNRRARGRRCRGARATPRACVAASGRRPCRNHRAGGRRGEVARRPGVRSRVGRARGTLDASPAGGRAAPPASPGGPRPSRSGCNAARRGDRDARPRARSARRAACRGVDLTRPDRVGGRGNRSRDRCISRQRSQNGRTRRSSSASSTSSLRGAFATRGNVAAAEPHARAAVELAASIGKPALTARALGGARPSTTFHLDGPDAFELAERAVRRRAVGR